MKDPFRLVPDEDEMAAMDRELARFMLRFVLTVLGIGIPLGALIGWWLNQ